MSTIASKPFADDGRLAVHGVRRALAEMLASVDADPAQPQELSRRFGLDKTLTWRIARVIREEDAWEAVQHIPRRPSIRIFASALAKHGAPVERVQSLYTALGEFERFVEVHSGDRETLEMMASASAKRSSAKRLEAFRKSGFQANSAIWGVRAKTQISAHIMTPSPDSPDGLVTATVCGLVDFRRLRADVPWAVASLAQWDDASSNGATWQAVPLDSTIGANRAPLLHEFCTDPLPELHQVRERPDLARYMLADGPVGNTAAATLVFGWSYVGAASRVETYPGEIGEHGVALSTPVETLVHDLFVHRSLDFAFNPTAHVYSQLPGGPQYPASGKLAGLLPVPDEVIDLGASPPEIAATEIPRYREMVEYAVEKVGCSLNDFQGYRFRVRYPPIPTIAVLRHALLRRK